MARKKPPMLYTYPGGKYKLAEKYRLYYPPHHCFVSPFCGSGAEIMCKEPSPIEVYNDKDELLLNVWRVLQDDELCEALVDLFTNTPDSRRQYENCHQVLKNPNLENSLVRKAWAYLVCATTGYHGPHPALTRSWSTYRHAKHSSVARLLRLPDVIQIWRDRFKLVRLEGKEWYEIFDRYDHPDTLFFVDPPYHPDTCSAGLYQHELTADQHVELLERLNRVKGFVMLCGINHPVYQQHLFHWRRISFMTKTTMTRGKKKPPRKEEIWLNYEADGSKVHEHKRLITERYVKAMGSMEDAEQCIQRLKTFRELPK